MLALRLSPGHTDAVTGPCQGGAGSKTCPETKCHLLLPYGTPILQILRKATQKLSPRPLGAGTVGLRSLRITFNSSLFVSRRGAGGGISLITH